MHTSTNPAEPPATICNAACFSSEIFGFSDFVAESEPIVTYNPYLQTNLNINRKPKRKKVNRIRSFEPAKKVNKPENLLNLNSFVLDLMCLL